MPETKVGDIVHVEKSWALCGIMEGNEYEVTWVEGDAVGVSNGMFFSSLKWGDDDRWRVV